MLVESTALLGSNTPIKGYGDYIILLRRSLQAAS
jgi:hypothetical protein